MQETSNSGVYKSRDRSQWVRLQTLTGLRWVAICGQMIAIAITSSQFGILIDLGLTTIAIGAAVCMNLVTHLVYPENKRLTEAEAMGMLLFDLLQLAFLVALTGGLHNPFALLVLTPVVISATALRLRSTVLLGLVAIGIISVMAFVYIPMQLEDGTILKMPEIFLFGFWAAIVIGVAFLSAYAGRVTAEINSMTDALWATQNALAREQKLTDLDGVVAAAAHELGTPLATIKLASSELADDLPEGSDLREDAILIRDQADRCRDILRSMGRAGKDDKHMRQVPLETLVKDAANPHLDRGIDLHFDFHPLPEGLDRQPTVVRSPEIIHGLRNLIQNAVDFSKGNVWVLGRWDEQEISLAILDDGPGFTANDIARIGDPFMRRRRSGTPKRRPGYEGMGLGLFIAKTLLERSGAELTFVNAPENSLAVGDLPDAKGALITVVWPAELIQRADPEDSEPLGENIRFEV
ncbi:sensor histidine kinase RegB [Actibacterium pelagium]|uniref:histidine kinase n=1 Tax=Actibacterium pelagium TaxID=2029103 RepID=A0A917AJD9_9RHOB|nr:ActS/PrrB/RegB family redox-sensitive histidine kinase [Actibacterium pelagium]GGE55673.1 sensor histidine kinase RegB [Actibacterium pelagium]